MKLPLALVVVLAAAVAAHADPDRERFERELIDAIARRDSAAVLQRAGAPLVIFNLQFVAPKCRPFAAGRARVEPREVPVIVDCIAALGIHAAGADGIITYGPGIPLRLHTRNGPNGLELDALVSTIVASDALTVTPAAFLTHLKNFAREVAPDPVTRRGIDNSPRSLAYAALVVCIDRTGAIDTVTVTSSSGVFPDYAEQAANAARTWKATPFVIGKQRVRACSSLYVGYPAKALSFIDMVPPELPQ